MSDGGTISFARLPRREFKTIRPLNTVGRECFARALAVGLSPVEAVKLAYPNAENWTAKSVRVRASRLAHNAAIVRRVKEIVEAEAEAASLDVEEMPYYAPTRYEVRRTDAENFGRMLEEIAREMRRWLVRWREIGPNARTREELADLSRDFFRLIGEDACAAR